MFWIRGNNNYDEEESARRLRLPHRNEGEIFAIIKKMQGAAQVKAICEDGMERSCRITGKMRKRVWMREGDLIIIKVWDFQPIKADIVWRYLGGQKNLIERRGLLKGLQM
ncbi:MAG: translation initiation factor eIF-1A [Candidatus Diapherotrites archaeon]